MFNSTDGQVVSETEARKGSTNLFVSGLRDVDELGLVMAMGVFGDVSSVKVMWPRDEQGQPGRPRGRGQAQTQSGFVSFMSAASAAEALRVMDGRELNGSRISVVWSKRVQLPQRALYTQAAVVWARAAGRHPDEYSALAGEAAPEAEDAEVAALATGCARYALCMRCCSLVIVNVITDLTCCCIFFPQT
jgi:hypothetical protein